MKLKSFSDLIAFIEGESSWRFLKTTRTPTGTITDCDTPSGAQIEIIDDVDPESCCINCWTPTAVQAATIVLTPYELELMRQTIAKRSATTFSQPLWPIHTTSELIVGSNFVRIDTTADPVARDATWLHHAHVRDVDGQVSSTEAKSKGGECFSAHEAFARRTCHAIKAGTFPFQKRSSK